ncbi:MAG: oligoendopeptidase F [Acholeplasmataceae bacterium]|nr:oligoendopeptidase F [Acholeplasmataceae bacterium]
MKEVHEMSKWDLSPFYQEMTAWEHDLALVPEKIEVLHQFKGKLHDYDQFLAFYQTQEEITKFIYRLYGYIHLGSDLNLKDREKATKNQQLMLMFAQLSQKTAFVSPELIALGKEKVMDFLNRSDFLQTYRFQMEKLFFSQKHVLTNDQEALLANFSPIRNVPSSLYQGLAIVDAIDQEVTFKDGTKQVVTQANYRALIQGLDDAEDRAKVFNAVFKRYKDNKTTFAATYNLVLQQLASHYKSRGYDSALDAALFNNNIPIDVYKNLMDAAYENNESIQRYLALRKKALNLEVYHTYDRFLTLVKDDTKYSYERSKEIFLESIKHLDTDFVNHQKEAIADGYVDAYPSDGKRTGAYSSGLYGFHPYIMLNHDDTLDGLFTLAHEAGHSAHTLYSHENQPMASASYTIFVAEIASTFNEHILLDYLVQNAETKNQKIALLEKAIDGIMSTFFRQTLFATYEYKANELVQKGIPLTEQSLSKIMVDLYQHYYDLDIENEDGKEYVWAYIPHLFYSPFYVYQYATSFSASLKIYDDVKNNVPGAMEKYINLLKSGGSDYPVEQAKLAGADLTQKETFTAVIRRFNQLVDELEKTLA